MLVPDVVMAEILSGYRLSPMGIHGVAHWGRVLETGLRLAEDTGADEKVVTLFAVFHDARRWNDGHDPRHGRRGAELASELSPLLGLTGAQLEQLVYASTHHTDGLTEADPTVQTCWDADRLDLWRVGITPHAPWLCTDAAYDPELLEWTRIRSLDDHLPDCAAGLLTTLLAAENVRAGCGWSTIQVVGDFNAWNEMMPSMVEVSPCVWNDTLYVEPGCYFVKFRTDFFWGSDFGRCEGIEEPCQVPVPGDGSTFSQPTCPADAGNAIGQLEFTTAGAYEFRLDEGKSFFGIRRIGDTAPARGSISGTLSFSDDPPVIPETIMGVVPAGSENPAVVAWATGPTFTFTELRAGTYTLLFFAQGYDLTIVENVVVDPPGDTNVGTVVIEPYVCESQFSSMQVVGGFNDWNIDVEGMSRDGCVWTDTVSVAAGCHLMKFRTDNTWDDRDLGRCDGVETICELPVPPDGTPLVGPYCLRGGMGTALGEIEFPETAWYVFTVDEETFTFSIRYLGVISVEPLSWGAIKERYRNR